MTHAVHTTRYEINNWWWFGVVGLLMLAAGIAIFARPAEGYAGLSLLFSWVMIGAGYAI